MSADAVPRSSLTMALVGVGVTLALCYVLRGILIPFFTAALMIALIDGLVRILGQRWPTGPRWALTVIAGVIIIALLAVCAIVLSIGAAQIATDAPDIIQRLDTLARGVTASLSLPPPNLTAVASPERVMSALARFSLASAICSRASPSPRSSSASCWRRDRCC